MNMLKFKGLSSVFGVVILLTLAILMFMSMIATIDAVYVSSVEIIENDNGKIGVQKSTVADPQEVTEKKYKKVKTYTLTFNANGGNVTTKTKKLAYKKSYGTLPKPTRSGYTFDGWYTKKSGGKKVSATTKMAAKNTVVYAQWKKNQGLNANEKALVGQWSVTPKLSINEVREWIEFKSDRSFKYYNSYTRVAGYFHEKNEATLTGNYRISGNKMSVSKIPWHEVMKMYVKFSDY